MLLEIRKVVFLSIHRLRIRIPLLFIPLFRQAEQRYNLAFSESYTLEECNFL